MIKKSPEIMLEDTIDDKFEQQSLTQSTKKRFLDFEKEQKLREMIDMKIERVVLNLGISRSSVHFIENYKFDGEPANT